MGLRSQPLGLAVARGLWGSCVQEGCVPCSEAEKPSGAFSQKPRPAQVHLVGNDRLLASYAHALTSLGIGVQRHPEDLAAHGLHALWSKRNATRSIPESV